MVCVVLNIVSYGCGDYINKYFINKKNKIIPNFYII